MTDPFEPPAPPAPGSDPTSAYPIDLAHADTAPALLDEVDDDAERADDTDEAATSERRKRRARGLIDWIVVVGIALIVAFVVRTYVLAHFVVDGQSMDYTLHDGDRVFVNKLSYRLHDPRRGDVVVLHQDAVDGQANRDLIKRVIALPGETIAMRNCVVTIDGVVLEEPYLDDTVVTPGNCGPEIPPTLIDDGHVFVMGDNRPASQDSRAEAVGQVDFDDLVGRAFVVFWPTSHWRWL